MYQSIQYQRLIDAGVTPGDAAALEIPDYVAPSPVTTTVAAEIAKAGSYDEYAKRLLGDPTYYAEVKANLGLDGQGNAPAPVIAAPVGPAFITPQPLNPPSIGVDVPAPIQNFGLPPMEQGFPAMMIPVAVDPSDRPGNRCGVPDSPSDRPGNRCGVPDSPITAASPSPIPSATALLPPVNIQKTDLASRYAAVSSALAGGQAAASSLNANRVDVPSSTAPASFAGQMPALAPGQAAPQMVNGVPLSTHNLLIGLFILLLILMVVFHHGRGGHVGH